MDVLGSYLLINNYLPIIAKKLGLSTPLEVWLDNAFHIRTFNQSLIL